MNRQEIIATWNVVDGLIEKDGQFGGKPLYVPYYWDLALLGDGESLWLDDIEYTLIDIQNEDRIMFPELEDIKQVLLHTDDQGFVHCEEDPDLSEFDDFDTNDFVE